MPERAGSGSERNVRSDDTSVRYWACGCRTDEGHDEARHIRNAERAADAAAWAAHEAQVAEHG